MSDIPSRIRQIMDYYELTSTQLANKLTIQKSSLSHLLSGRNKPGFEFLKKLAENFPELNIKWFLTGDGEMIQSSPTPLPENPSRKVDEEKDKSTKSFSTFPDEIIKIYPDGTFEVLKRRNQ